MSAIKSDEEMDKYWDMEHSPTYLKWVTSRSEEETEHWLKVGREELGLNL